VAVGRISGQLLQSNLVRNGLDLVFDTNLLYLDTNNRRIGVNNTTPTSDFDITGNLSVGEIAADGAIIHDVVIDENKISTAASNLRLETAEADGKIEVNRNFLVPDDFTINFATENGALNINGGFQINGVAGLAEIDCGEY
jgi:hypothetical protein